MLFRSQKRDRIRITDRKVEELEQSYAEQLARIKEERNQIVKQAKEEARQLIAEANRQIENTIRTIRESQAEKELTLLARRELDGFRQQVEQEPDDPERSARIDREMDKLQRRQQRRNERRQQTAHAAPEGAPSPESEKREAAVGSKVRIEGQDTLGEIQSIKGKKAVVAFGHILTTVDLSRLTVISNAEYKRQTRPRVSTVVSVDISQRKLNFKNHIDIRGMRAAEALETVQNFIDDALMVGVADATILHGKGTGALKEEIRRYLRTVDEVESARDEQEQLGGAGITVVKFKQ